MSETKLVDTTLLPLGPPSATPPQDIRAAVVAAVQRKAAFRKGELKSDIAIARARLAQENAALEIRLRKARRRELVNCVLAAALGGGLGLAIGLMV